MTPLSIQVPFPVFQGRDGQPLENGYIWIGEPNLNPQTNPVMAYYDAALTIVAPQPMRTLNGYVSRAGTPAQIYVDGMNFSILVQDSKGTMVYNFPDGTGISPDACGVTYNPPFAGGVPYPVCEKLAQTVSAADFGADPTGVADSTSAIVAALATGKDVMLPDGTYKLIPTAAQTIANQGYQRLYGSGSVTLSVNLASCIDLFIFNGSVAIENLTVDFNNSYCRRAFRWSANAGNVQIKNLRVQNLRDIDSTLESSTFSIAPTGNTFEVDDVRASSMLKRGNGSQGDGGGSYNMIVVSDGSGATQGSIKNVVASEIHNIDASNNIIYEDTSVVYIATDSNDLLNRIEVDNIQGYNFGKRLLKVQASNVSISNCTGNSPEGDSLSVISLQSDAATIGLKFGCSATNIRCNGKISYGVETNAPGSVIKNVTASITPGTKPGMTNESISVRIGGSGITLDGLRSSSRQDVGIGTSSEIVKNITLRNLTTFLNNLKPYGSTIFNNSDTSGFDGLLIDGLNTTVDSDTGAFMAPIWLYDYLNGTTKKGRNLIVKNVVVQSNGPTNAQGMHFRFVENVTVESVKYINTSGLSHSRIVEITSCSNVNVDDVVIEGVNTVGVHVGGCTGRNTINRVYNPSASQAAVNNFNSTDVTVMNCNTTQVSGTTTPAWQNSKMTFGTTANRPTVGLTPYFTQYLDTTLGKPIWWNGTVWKDSAGTTV